MLCCNLVPRRIRRSPRRSLLPAASLFPPLLDRMAANAPNRAAKEFTHISCTFDMMRAAFGPVLPATSQVTVMLVYAEETPSDFAREVPEGTRYVDM